MADWPKRYLGRPPSESEMACYSSNGAGVGVVLGEASGGIVAIDIDTTNERIVAALADILPPSLVRKIGRKGYTDFFHAPEPLKAQKWKIKGEMVVELLSDGNQTVLPPTVHPDTGEPYRWIGGDTLADLAPDELPALCPDIADKITSVLVRFGYRTEPEPRLTAEAPQQDASHGVGARERAYAQAALRGCCDDVAGTPEGGRNDLLFQKVAKLGNMICSGWIERAVVEPALAQAALASGLPPNEIRATIRSGIERGLRAPHPPLRDRERPQHDPETGEIYDANPLRGFVFDDDTGIEMPDYLVKGMLPAEGVAFIGGQSGSGKTFVAIHLAVCLASGASFFGPRVKEPIGVAVLAAEGAGTYKARLRIARRRAVGDTTLPICYLGSVPDLKDQREIDALAPRLQAVSEHFQRTHGVRLGVVIVDTVAAAFDLDDENDNSGSRAHDQGR
jgi:hypothetical protein